MIRPKVVAVRVRDSYVLEVDFDDGEHRTIDMSARLNGKVFEPLRDPEFFAKVSIDPVWHTLVWPNGADLAPEFVYEKSPEKVRR
jgi:hypothetical protein